MEASRATVVVVAVRRSRRLRGCLARILRTSVCNHRGNIEGFFDDSSALLPTCVVKEGRGLHTDAEGAHEMLFGASRLVVFGITALRSGRL